MGLVDSIGIGLLCDLGLDTRSKVCRVRRGDCGNGLETS